MVLDEDQKRVFDERFKLVTRKGVYPYNYFDTFDRFDETALPSKEAFYNELKDTPITDADNDHAELIKLWIDSSFILSLSLFLQDYFSI